MKAQIKAITAWSFLAGACILGGILVFSSESAHTQPFPPVERVSTGSNGQPSNEGSAGSRGLALPSSRAFPGVVLHDGAGTAGAAPRNRLHCWSPIQTDHRRRLRASGDLLH